MTGFVKRRDVLSNLESRGFRAKQTRGQNFLFDPQLLGSFLADSEVKSGERVLEVGPGAGTLTRALLACGAWVTAVELDPVLCAYLRDEVRSPRFDLIEGDVLRSKSQLHPRVLERLEDLGSFRLIANLPYSIATTLVQLLLEHAPGFQGFGVLVQREIAARWTAAIGGRDYSAITVVLSLMGVARVTRAVGRQMFTPAPRVDSSFVVWTRNADVGFAQVRSAHRWARHLFGQRRKMLRSSLGDDLPNEDPRLAELGIDLSRRPEELPAAAFRVLAEELDRRGIEPPGKGTEATIGD